MAQRVEAVRWKAVPSVKEAAAAAGVCRDGI